MKPSYKIEITGEELDLIIECLDHVRAFDLAQGPTRGAAGVETLARIKALEGVITYLGIMLDERKPNEAW